MTTIAKCQCKDCNNNGTVKLQLSRRGNRPAYVCDFHAHLNESYFKKNQIRLGTAKVNGFTFSQELETSFSTVNARIELLASGYIPTDDSTVDCEYKSAITSGLNSLAKHCVTIDRLVENGELSVEDTDRYSVGTHLHVGHVNYINAETMGYIKRFYHSLFVPLCKTMILHPEQTKNLFGRNFGHWANVIGNESNPTCHTNFINTQHDYTLEFRLCKYQNADQYMKAVHFCKDVTNTVINNFIKHFNDSDIDSSRYSNITEYRKHKAKVTAKKLVKLFEKYTA